MIVFQDQVLAVAEALAGFSPGQAEGLRRAMSRRRSEAAMRAQWDAFREGAAAKDVPEHVAALVFEKILAFSAFGFPKAHSAAFALLAYQSAWLRRYHPAAFLCALLNAQPMGFYPPASLIRDGQRRGVEVRAPDVTRSAALCRLEDGAVRIGLGYVTGLGEEGAATVVAERAANGPFADGRDLATRLELKADALERLVASGACDGLGPRRRLLWELGLAARPVAVRGGHRQLALDLGLGEAPELPVAGRLGAARGRLRPHRPVAPRAPDRARPPRSRRGGLERGPDDAPERHPDRIPGLAIARQRPASANGVVFLLLEDEHGLVNLILMPPVYERFRLLARTEPLLLATGTLERRDRNVNVQVERLDPLETPGRRTIGPHRRDRTRRRPAAAVVQDLRAVAPPAMHFAQGRRRA